MDLDIDDEKSLRCFTPGGGAVKTLAATPLQLAHNLINNTDSGVHSQQSLKSVKIEILQPEVKGGLILEGKVSFFGQCSKMHIILFQKFNIKTYFIQFLWFFRLKC